MPSWTITLLLFTTLLLTGRATASDRPLPRIEISADYRYALHETESLTEAKTLACHEAWRMAVINSPLYREHTALIVDSHLLRNIADTLAVSHVQDRQIIEETERKRILTCRVRGFLPTEESARVIHTHLAGGPPSAEGLDQNRALRILMVQDTGNGMIMVQYQARTRLDWLGTHYQGGLREAADIMVDFYDEQSRLLRTDRFPAHRTATGEDVLNPGATAILTIPKPPTAKTYRVWLVK